MISGIRLHIEIGDTIIERCPRLEIISTRHRPLDLAHIHIPDPTGEGENFFTYGDPVRIEYGYRGGMSAVWQGSLRSAHRVSRDQLCLTADSMALPLVSTHVTECYTDDFSQFMVKDIIKHAGLPIGRIDIPNEPLARLPIATLPIWQAVLQVLYTVRLAYGHDISRIALWLGAEGVNLGDFDAPGDVPVIATGENLIRHLTATKKNGLHTVETVLLPGLSHSRIFHLIDSRLGVDQELRALHVKHAITPKSVRTFIEYGRELR